MKKLLVNWGVEDGLLIDKTILNPYTTRQAMNKATGGEATAYFQENGSCIVKDNTTNAVIQISDRTNPKWVPDETIFNSYIPKK
ncbi:colicin E5-related ribonuclease [Chitinophaga sp. LS1]|uniref:colicin E5-related ribonuclease n=1 Tax=Chitinophaga sp. LS1 TaxID=3051176 RepID=UPI002AAB8B04|nr:colicin E5-related ribonuclease [Chitinophaga sp. LS1]WPV63897.1 colicin E5-related ribonuclease [Chitinophaga sp. LS1]